MWYNRSIRTGNTDKTVKGEGGYNVTYRQGLVGVMLVLVVVEMVFWVNLVLTIGFTHFLLEW